MNATKRVKVDGHDDRLITEFEKLFEGKDYLLIYTRPEEIVRGEGYRTVRYVTAISENMRAEQALAALLHQIPELKVLVGRELMLLGMTEQGATGENDATPN